MQETQETLDFIPGLVRSPRVGNGKLLWYSCLENPTDRGAWWAIVHEVTKSWTQLSAHTRIHVHTHTCTFRSQQQRAGKE